jgi:putative glycosyltransferase
MLEMASRNPLRRFFQLYYKARIAPIIKKNEIYVIRQQDDDYVERCLGVPKILSPWISFGSDILIFHPDREERNRFRVENGISEAAFVVIYAGKLTEEKGADFLAKTIREKINGNKEIVFVIVGNTQGEFGDKVQKEFEESENRILRFPAQKYSDLPRFYQAADLALFPSQCSMSFYDVEACGVPVLSEANNINIDRCSHRNGWNFVKRDILDFRKKILDILNLDEDTYNDYRKSAFNYVVNHYNYEKKAREYEALFLKVVYSWKEVK